MSEVAYSTKFCVVTNHKAPTSLMSSLKWNNKITGLGDALIAVQIQYHLQTTLAETGGVFETGEGDAGLAPLHWILLTKLNSSIGKREKLEICRDHPYALLLWW